MRNQALTAESVQRESKEKVKRIPREHKENTKRNQEQKAKTGEETAKGEQEEKVTFISESLDQLIENCSIKAKSPQQNSTLSK